MHWFMWSGEEIMKWNDWKINLLGQWVKPGFDRGFLNQSRGEFIPQSQVE